MGRPRPFLFCRYGIYIEGERLEPGPEFTFLSEMQGEAAAHGKKAAREGIFDSLVMRPRRHRKGGLVYFSWSVGQIIDTRIRARYDESGDVLVLQEIPDGGVRYSDFVAVPSLGVLAVDDRASSDLHLGGKAAINRFKSVVESYEDANLELYSEVTPDEVRRALDTWSVEKYSFTIRPNNPRPVSRLAARLGEQMRASGIGQLRGVAKPEPGGTMQRGDDGLIEATNELTNAGYGQEAITGFTADGLRAEIKKPRFDYEPQKNDRNREKPRQLRVFVETENDDEEEIMFTAAASLDRFYNGDA